MKLSDKLFSTRMENKLSKQEVANRLNMDVTTYGRVESGKRSLEIDKLKLLPDALGIDAKEILELLDIDKGNTFNINNEEYASGNGYVENYYMENKEVLNELKLHFRPEFLNRLDDIIIFEQLNLEAITSIVDILFNNIKKKLEDKDIEISITKEAKEHLAKVGFDPVYGARPLKRAIYEEIEDRLAMLILEEKISENSKVLFDLDDNEIITKNS
jgi:ATP-dependent Clp protease ATP-binding subunit ClpB